MKKSLEIKIMRVKPMKDNKGRYIPFCDFGYHQGILKDTSICTERHCKHYQKLYINTLQDLERVHREIK